MELVEGEDLSERIARGAIPIDEAIPIALQIAEALEAAHESGIVHRDLKPANIKLRPDGTVKVLDFGLAKAWETDNTDSSLSLSPTMTQHATAAGVILGTAAYMSPEQAAGTEADRRADIWAFGVVLWEMLSGNKLFAGETVSHVLAAVLKDDVDLDQLPADVPPRLRELISRCLRRTPKQRLQSIGDARIVLEEDLSTAGLFGDSTGGEMVERGGSSRWMLAALLALGAAFITMAGWTLLSPQQSPRLIQSSLVAPRGERILASQGLAISPDGTLLAVVATRGESNLIWVRQMDSLTARPLEGTENAILPFWSPDGRHVGFFADGKLKRVPAVGGATKTLADAIEPRGGTWGPDDRIFFNRDYRDGLWMVPANGGEASRLTDLDDQRGEKSHRWPVILPDGRHLLFLAQTAEGGSSTDRSSIEALSLEDGSRTRILDANSSVAYSPTGDLLFWRDGSLYSQSFDLGRLAVDGESIQVASDVGYTQNERAVFAVSNEGTLVYHQGPGVKQPASLEWYSRGGEMISEAAPSAIYRETSLSSDGRRIAFTEGLTVWVRDLERGTTSRVTDDEEDHIMPAWSPDGDWLAFTTNRTAGSEVRKKLASGLGNEELVVTLDHVGYARSWSSDGRYLALQILGPGTEWDCWLYSIDDDELRPIVKTKFTDIEPSFSPDGRWITYVSTETGRPEIYIVPTHDQSRKWQVSTEGGRSPTWVAAGNEIIFADLENRIMTVSVRGSVDLEIGVPQALFRMPEQPTPFGAFDFANYGVSPDGSRILVHHSSEQGRAADSLTLVQDWVELVRGDDR